MKAALWYLLAGLEVWLGVSAILLGSYALFSSLTSDTPASSPVLVAAVVAIVVGVGLVVDAVRRELGDRTTNASGRFKNPLDAPTRPGHT